MRARNNDPGPDRVESHRVGSVARQASGPVEPARTGPAGRPCGERAEAAQEAEDPLAPAADLPQVPPAASLHQTSVRLFTGIA
jgi:hypothetical protein